MKQMHTSRKVPLSPWVDPRALWLLASLFLMPMNGKSQVVAGGYGHSLVVCRDGTARSSGINSDGELSCNSNDPSRPTPIQVLRQSSSGSPEVMQDVVAVAAGTGSHHSLFLLSNGTVWAAGDNEYGQLGDTTTTDRRVAVQVLRRDGTPLTGIRGIAAGWGHSLFLSTDGTVWAVGNNADGQLGRGTVGGKDSVCVKVKGPGGTDTLRNIIAIAAGEDHSLFLTQQGTVWAVGANYSGQLGDGTYQRRSTVVQALKSDGSPLDSIIAISAGRYHSLFLRRDGTVWAAGDNSKGQLGDGTNSDRPSAVQVKKSDSTLLTDVVAIAAGGLHSLFLRRDGTVWATGSSMGGQLGDSTIFSTKNLAVQVRTQNGPLTNVVAIGAGDDFSLFVRSDGSVWGAGSAGSGQIGVQVSPSWLGRARVAIPTNFCQARVSGASFLSSTAGRDRPPLVSPNPNGGIFTVRLEQVVEQMEVRVQDLTGRLIEVVEGRGDAVTLNLTGRPGIYLVEVRTPEASLSPVKVIVTE